MALLLLLGLFVCSIAAICDLRNGTIPNWLTYPLLVVSPFLHVARGFQQGLSASEALGQGGLALLGILACGVIPLFMWQRGALGGGDVKLFAGLGALLLPRVGFDAQFYVLLTAALLAPAKLAYQGTLLRTLRNVFGRALRVVRRGSDGLALDPNLVSWFRLGPCFAIGVAVVLVLRWRAL